MSWIGSEWPLAARERASMELGRPFRVLYQCGGAWGAFAYPLRGVLFFVHNATPLMPIFVSVVIPYAAIHLYTYGVLLIVLVPLNVFIHTLCMGPLGIQLGILSAVQQCSCINNYIFKRYLVGGKLTKVFDTTLCIMGLDRVVVPGKLKRLVPQTLGSKTLDVNPVTVSAQVGHLWYRTIVSLVPVVGPLITWYNQCIDISMETQSRMWRLTRMRPRAIKYYAKDHEVDLFVFGCLCQMLESIPLLGLFFCFTDVCAGALMAGEEYERTSGYH